MKTLSVSNLKGNRSNSKQLLPKQGSKVRILYDLFKSNPGIVIDFKLPKGDHHALDLLTDSYGLDIRCIRQGKWVLAGEWFGKEYKDYIAERIIGKDNVGK